jgi:biopolymer transport protein ExbD
MSISVREARSIIRKAKKRVPEGEDINHLNIMPMLDIMTILLVFMIKQASVGATDIMPPDVTPPRSTTQQPIPEEGTPVFIGTKAILVDGTPIVAVTNGDVDPSERAGGAQGLEITKLRNTLALHRQAFRSSEGVGPVDLTVIADKSTPYRLLMSVMYSAKQACSRQADCYKQYRLIVSRGDAAF